MDGRRGGEVPLARVVPPAALNLKWGHSVGEIKGGAGMRQRWVDGEAAGVIGVREKISVAGLYLVWFFQFKS